MMDFEKMQNLMNDMKQIRENTNENGMSPEEANELFMQGVEEFENDNLDVTVQ